MLAKFHGLHDDLKAARRDVCYAAWQAISVSCHTTLACNCRLLWESRWQVFANQAFATLLCVISFTAATQVQGLVQTPAFIHSRVYNLQFQTIIYDASKMVLKLYESPMKGGRCVITIAACLTLQRGAGTLLNRY